MVKRGAKRERFLSVMEGVMPWEKLEELLQPFYGKQGRIKNHSKVLILAALTNLFMMRNQISSMKIT